ncbi:hypothetical protein N431DRAFT_282795, partial [Stipitochalara longipes BDJ]
KINWRVPTVMASSLLLGIFSAVGHHVLYSHYDGQFVNNLTKQRYIINGGTGLAFLVKMFLAIATGTAYVQQFWLDVKHGPKSFDTIDTLYSILGNAFLFFNLKLWGRNLILAWLALITWCLPLASVVTPGTITVQPIVMVSNNLIRPPQPLYNTQNYASAYIPDRADEGPCIAYLVGPTSEVLRIALAAAAQQTVLQIPSTLPNSSYNVEFLGPAVSCFDAPAQNISAFNEALASANVAPNSIDDPELYYNAWVPHIAYNADTDTNHIYDLTNPDWNNATIVTKPDSPNKGQGGASIYVYLPTDIVSRAPFTAKGTVLLTCTLHNSTYNVNFDYKNSQQTVTVNSLDFHEEVANPGSYQCADPHLWDQASISIMWAFTKLLVGSATDNGGATGITANSTPATYTSTLVGATMLRPFIEDGQNASSTMVASILESMFQNITLSMLSSDQFVLASNITPQVQTTVTNSVNIFIYRRITLLVTYGSSIACALICVIVGCFALLRNKLSYSNDFSTILRTTRRPELDMIVHESERIGADPLPNGIARTKVM